MATVGDGRGGCGSSGDERGCPRVSACRGGANGTGGGSGRGRNRRGTVAAVRAVRGVHAACGMPVRGGRVTFRSVQCEILSSEYVIMSRASRDS